jgi:hypothetical protein
MRQHQASALLLRLAGIVIGIGILAIVGCGDGRIPTYEVNGQVNVNGRPAEGAIVVFCPVDPSAEVEHLRPAGMANASGQFTLTTFEPNDGAPAGEYKVLVKWPAPTPAAQQREERPGSANKGPDRLRGKYYSFESTPLQATIEEQSNQLPPFELKST